MTANILAIDQGTTSSRAIVFDGKQRIAGLGKMEFTQHFPHGWLGGARARGDLGDDAVVGQDRAEEGRARARASIAAIGITNQRETTIVWDRATGKAIYNAIVWQDRRTADACEKLKKAGHEKLIIEEDRAAARSLFQRDQAELDPRPRAGRAEARRGRASSPSARWTAT